MLFSYPNEVRKIELKALCEKTIEIFGIKDIHELKNALYKCVVEHDSKKMRLFADTVGDLSVDWLQKIYQYYEADRAEKKQDYTPASICELCACLTETGGETVYDLCAGSGALTIRKWAHNPDKMFICEELDENVIPFLLFNMAVRNMDGLIINRNALTGECFGTYHLSAGADFSWIYKTDGAPDFTADEIISNPPYNIKWDAPAPLLADERFKGAIPPASKANFAFVLTALSRMNKSGKCAFVLPCGVLSSSVESYVRKHLVESGSIKKIIVMPDNMFESTSIGTCVFLFSFGNDSVQVYDCRGKAVQEQRDQNGQYGGSSHTNRTYHKTINVLPDHVIKDLCGDCENIPMYSAVVQNEKFAENKYDVSPARYIEFEESELKQHRPYSDIVKNLNDIIRIRNSCKLVINETLAKQLGLNTDDFKESIRLSKENNVNMEKLTGEKILPDDYIAFTKNKNEICFKSNDKETLSHLFTFFINSWKQDIHLLNEFENIYLTELRDALLPDLMSGKIDVSGKATDSSGSVGTVGTPINME